MEIEKKILVLDKSIIDNLTGKKITQAYLSLDPERVVRVRIYGDEAFLTVKGITKGISREEFEYPIDLNEANEMIKSICLPNPIEKTRYVLDRWEIDVFHGVNEGLVVAEIELSSEDEEIDLPPWAGEDVSLDKRYYNSNLMSSPYMDWKLQSNCEHYKLNKTLPNTTTDEPMVCVNGKCVIGCLLSKEDCQCDKDLGNSQQPDAGVKENNPN